MDAAKRLEKIGINAAVVNCRFAKPLDEDLIISFAKKTGKVMTVEENALDGGFGSAVLELLEKNGLSGCSVKRIGVPDEFVEHGSQKELRRLYCLDADGIEKTAMDMTKDDASKRKRAC